MRWLSRWRWVLARRPWIRWLVVAMMAGTAALAVHREVAAQQRARDGWGTTVEVLVATRTLLPGDALAGATVRRAYPVALVPAAAADVTVADGVVTQRVSVGEVVVSDDVAAAEGPLALLPTGWLAVTLTDAEPASWIRTGDVAVVLADGTFAAEEAVVLSHTETEVVVGVPAGDAAAVADAANRRVAVVAVSASPRR